MKHPLSIARFGLGKEKREITHWIPFSVPLRYSPASIFGARLWLEIWSNIHSRWSPGLNEATWLDTKCPVRESKTLSLDPTIMGFSLGYTCRSYLSIMEWVSARSLMNQLGRSHHIRLFSKFEVQQKSLNSLSTSSSENRALLCLILQNILLIRGFNGGPLWFIHRMLCLSLVGWVKALSCNFNSQLWQHEFQLGISTQGSC